MLVFDPAAIMDGASYGYTPEVIDCLVTGNTQIDMKWWSTWQANMISNMNNIFAKHIQPLSSIYGEWDGLDCLVVGAGPSLTQNMDHVRQAAEKGFKIVCVDRAFNKLKYAGISPDITITMDANEKVGNFFIDNQINENDTFALCVITHPSVYKALSGSNVYFYSCINPFSAFWKYAIDCIGISYACIRPGFVVTFSAVDLALWMGAKRIVTIGNELCWKLDDEVDTGYKKYIVLPGGKFTIKSFQKASIAFRFFPDKYPDIEFIDASDGIISKTWQRASLEEILKKENYHEKN